MGEKVEVREAVTVFDGQALCLTHAGLVLSLQWAAIEEVTAAENRRKETDG